jgi:Gti1/Pac2 family transcription factor
MPSSSDVKPFVGYVETTLHALRLIYAARQGVIPRITRRLNDAERKSMIQSGAVFVFGVEESGIKRWTDGLLWSPSRIVGNFLVRSFHSSVRGPRRWACRLTKSSDAGNRALKMMQ